MTLDICEQCSVFTHGTRILCDLLNDWVASVRYPVYILIWTFFFFFIDFGAYTKWNWFIQRHRYMAQNGTVWYHICSTKWKEKSINYFYNKIIINQMISLVAVTPVHGKEELWNDFFSRKSCTYTYNDNKDCKTKTNGNFRTISP